MTQGIRCAVRRELELQRSDILRVFFYQDTIFEDCFHPFLRNKRNFISDIGKDCDCSELVL